MKLKLHYAIIYAIIVIILQSSLSIASINNLQANELEFEIEEIEEDLNQSNPETSDSLEGFNRFMYGFYKGIYDYGFKYVVVGYDSLPNFFKDCFKNLYFKSK
jgi:ABC-type transporter lipoprotein component MlaA